MRKGTDVFEELAAAQGPTPKLGKLVHEATAIARRLRAMEEELAELSSKFREITERKLPEEMAASGCERFEGKDGSVIEIKDFINGSIPKDEDRRTKAFDWLTKNGAEDLIRLSVAFNLDPSQKKAQKAVLAFAKKSGLTYDAAHKVHPQSLYAFVRERLESGEQVPVDTLGLYVGKVAKITLPSGKVKGPKKAKRGEQ